METIGYDLGEMERATLTAGQVAAVRAIGAEAVYPAGAFLVRPGDAADRLIFIESGEIEMVRALDDAGPPCRLGPSQFMAEVAFLNGGNWTMLVRACSEVRAIEAPRAQMLRLMSEVPEISDVIISVLTARRRRQIETHQGSLLLIGEDADRNMRQIAQFASRNRIPYASAPLGSPEARAAAQSCAISPDQPAVVFGRDTVLADPTPAKVARMIGFDSDLGIDRTFDVLVVGAGPAGIAAGVYAGAEGLSASWSRTWRWAARPARLAGSRTTWAFRPASRAGT